MDRPKLESPSKFFIFVLCIFILHPEPVSSGFAQHHFVPSKICGTLEDLSNAGCMTSGPARSAIECAVKCMGNNASCIGNVFDEDHSKCYLLKICDYASDNMNCLPNATSVTVSRKECQNGAEFTTKRGVVCHCKNGYIGDYCEQLATHCKEILGYGYGEDVIRTVSVNFRGRVQKMVCTTTQNFYSLGIFSNSGQYSHNRTWEDYKMGYFINRNNYWLGLENMYYLLQPTDTEAHVKGAFWFTNHTTLIKDFVYYDGFGVKDESENYTYFHSGVSFENNQDGIELPIQDCFPTEQLIQFSAWDQDRDLDIEHNCAKLTGAGGWFQNCSSFPPCNLMGQSVTKLLNKPMSHAHIAIKGIDMTPSSFWGPIFTKVEFTLVVPTT